MSDEDPAVTVREPRTATVGGAPVRRALPQRGLRTVGPWCFADHFGPELVTPTSGLDVGPHPHTGLHTVTWLLDGAVLHRDSLGSEQVIRPGELNLMTAGHGVVHAEQSVDEYRGVLHGVQLWLAQPSSTRNGPPAFAHLPQLPRVALGSSQVTVLLGRFDAVSSPGHTDGPLVGAEGRLRGAAVWPLDPTFEHAVVVLDGVARVAGAVVGPGSLAVLGPGRDELALDAADPARVLLLGGPPFPEPIVMFWNFVARGRDEVDQAVRQWQAADEDRFGRVATPLPRIASPLPPWTPRSGLC